MNSAQSKAYHKQWIEMIRAARADHGAAIIDIGGGASRLVDALLKDGYRELAVLDAVFGPLRARLLAKQQEERDAAASDARRSQIRGMDRSERIRTYNFPENRIADHRTGYKAYNLDAVMNGALEPVIQSAILADEESRLEALGTRQPRRRASPTSRRVPSRRVRPVGLAGSMTSSVW